MFRHVRSTEGGVQSLTESEPAGVKSTAIPWARILVSCDVAFIKYSLHTRAIQAFGPQIHQHEMRVRPAGHQSVASLD
jgi:hypothetical protein